jgi:hypothetical protein
MLDNLRDDANASPFFDDDDELPDFLDEEEEKQQAAKPQGDSLAFLKPIMVLTPVQRFILAALLFMTVCIIGSMFLLVTGKFSVF